MEIFPNVPGRDVITTGNGVTGLVLVSKPEKSPSDQGENSKSGTLWIKGWRSDTTERVEVLVMDGTGTGRILSDFSIPNNLPNRLRVFPGEGTVTNVVTSADPTNMHNTGTSDKQEYPLTLSFNVLRGADPGITPITLILRQGRDTFRVRLDLVVQVPGLSPPTLVGPIGAAATRSPTFSWNPVPNATRYEVWVVNSAGTRVLHTAGVSDTKWTADAFSWAGVRYTWWVREIAATGRRVPGASARASW